VQELTQPQTPSANEATAKSRLGKSGRSLGRNPGSNHGGRQRRRWTWWQWLFLTLIGLTLLVTGWWLNWEVPLISPLTDQSTFRFLLGHETPATQGKIVYGFLPYWNLSDVAIQPELTHLGYFALDIAANGSIRTTDPGGTAEPGYHRLGNETWFYVFADHNGPTELVFTQFDNDTIARFVTNQAAHDRFISELDDLLLAYPINGVNIDIEYSGQVTEPLRAGLVTFMETLHTHLHETYQDTITVSIDVYAGAGSNRTIWDIENLEPHTDYFIVMAYDFHRRQSVVAGPVAPLFGGKEYWDSDISAHFQGFLEHVPSQKLILGVPFYGYEWQTTSRDSQAHTFPNTGSTATFERVNEVLAQKDTLKVQEHWNEAALSPYLSYEEDGEIFVIYYENSRSLSYKLDFVNQLDLAGIAIWALGYEGQSRELWEVIDRKL